jgi:hypothetical protein
MIGWVGDDKLQFYTQADVVDRFRVRVRRTRNGVPVWNYFGVPAEVVVVLASVFADVKKPPTGGTGAVAANHEVE